MAERALNGLGRLAACLAAAASLAACASVAPEAPKGLVAHQKIGPPYQVGGIWYVPREQPNYDATGVASWYGDQFHLRPTADGEIFDMNAVSGAHTTLPLPCIVEVTNLDNGRRLLVRVNDRGPFVGGRIIDLSHEAARQLGYDRRGLARVRVRYVGPAPLLGPEAGVRLAQARPPAAPPQVAPSQVYPSQVATAALQDSDPDDEDDADAAAPPASATLRWRDTPGAQAATITTPQASAIQSPPSIEGAPISIAALPALAPDAAPAATSIEAWRQTAASGFRVQAGAFSEEARARRVAAQLAVVGVATVEPVQRHGVTFYRVVLPAPADELQAYNLRQRVAGLGFADARVVPAF